MQAARENPGRRQRGFTLVELMLATVVILVGLVAVAQLVPISVLLNSENRMDSTSLVVAQREMDLLLQQSLGSTTFTDANGLACPLAQTCDLGDPSQPNVLVGSPVVTAGSNVLVDFGAATVPGYCFAPPWLDPNDPSGVSYDIRWAVVTTGDGTTASGKRFIVGVRKVGGNGFFPPVTLDSAVRK
jgi:prepilin-type N-terminal cleavage/methylation domain-containing protein